MPPAGTLARVNGVKLAAGSGRLERNTLFGLMALKVSAMKKLDLLSLRQEFTHKNILLCFNGPISSNLIQELGEALKNYLQADQVTPTESMERLYRADPEHSPLRPAPGVRRAA